MSTISEWLMAILAVVLLGVVVDLILPNSTLSKYIKSTLATVTILVIILPLPSLINSGFDWESDLFSSSEITLDQDFLDYATEIKVSYLESGLISQLSDDGYDGLDINISAHSESGEIIVDYVYINVDNLVLELENEHIDKYEQVIELVCSYLEIESSKVVLA